jgi:hypothetical protein
MWSGRVLAKYWALQLPFTALLITALLWFEDDLGLPRWLTWTLVAAWVAKDAILYPLVWRSYDGGASDRGRRDGEDQGAAPLHAAGGGGGNGP